MKTRECPEFEKALSRGEDAVAALEIHAGSCDECRRQLNLWKEIPRVKEHHSRFCSTRKHSPFQSRGVSAISASPGRCRSVLRSTSFRGKGYFRWARQNR